MSNSKQNCLYGLIIIAIIALVWALIPSLDFKPHGIFLPTSKIHYAPTEVNSIRVTDSIPVNGIIIGTIRVTRHFSSVKTVSIRKDLAQNLEFAKAQAAKAGAQILVITKAGRTPNVGGLDGVVLYAKAVRLP